MAKLREQREAAGSAPASPEGGATGTAATDRPIPEPTPAADDTQAKLRAIAQREAADNPLTGTPTPGLAAVLEGDAQPSVVLPANGNPSEEEDEDSVSGAESGRDKNGRKTHRKYLILRPIGPGQYEEVHWFEDADGRMVPKGTKGAKRKKSAMCRGQEDALRIGYIAVGSPPAAPLIAVAQSAFMLKTVAPEAPQPSSVRLKIS